MRPLSILLLADDQKGHPNTIHDHIQAFVRYSRHDVTLFNPRNLARSRFLRLERYDAVVLHYSIVAIWDGYFSPWFRETLRAYKGLKIQFLQDEYRWVDEITAMTRHLEIDILYSVVPTKTVEQIYGGKLADTEVLFTLTGYVPEELQGISARPTDSRPIDVGYRGRSTPMWLGRLGFEKIEIGRGFLNGAAESGLNLDIAWTENARIYGDAWNEWVMSCKAMLASESGSSITDFDGSVELAVRAYLAAHPAAAYEEIERCVLARFPPTPVINTASPRIFEAAALGTAMILFPGEYSELVEPFRHYIPIEKDFSNLEDVIARLGDSETLSRLTTNAHNDLIASDQYSYRAFVSGFDEDVAVRAQARRRPAPTRIAEVGMMIEQLKTGRSWHISSVYDFARRSLLAWIGVRQATQSPALRSLLRRALVERGSTNGLPSLWDDVFRLALMTGIADRSLRVPESFVLAPGYDAEANCLTFTSAPAQSSDGGSSSNVAALSDAIARGGLSIVWNHAPVGQYVTLSIPGTSRGLGFDVGRYDAFGIYRFERLAALGSTSPNLLLEALTPLINAGTESTSKR